MDTPVGYTNEGGKYYAYYDLFPAIKNEKGAIYMADKQSREEVVNNAKEIGKQSEESGKRVGDALKELTVKISVDVDVSEAITGLKAVQREAKEATKALREMEALRGDD